MNERLNSTRLHAATVIGFSLVAVLGAAVFVLTFAVVPLIVGITAAAVTVGELVTKRFPLYAGIAVMAVLLFALQIAGPVIPRGEEHYAAQHTYISFLLRENVRFFPRSLPDNAEDYSMTYVSMFEGDCADYAVKFKTDSDTAALLASEAEESSITVINLTDFAEETDQYRRKLELLTGQRGITLPLEIPDYITSPEGWKIYVQYSSFQELYPRTGAVLINVDSGEACYIKHG